ncbi:hypothetical protein EJ02DRAFT_153258 [Clathrospora elynae]|uniref:Uncharacterized protein n=1 Tax=Clathrospora elynae TaxID=706981 RepID=A0A6A5S6K8_9PLEO|nr:hypothetical protein EJ02DRAFT_153258 [Clathrospora elynae]
MSYYGAYGGRDAGYGSGQGSFSNRYSASGSNDTGRYDASGASNGYGYGESSSQSCTGHTSSDSLRRAASTRNPYEGSYNYRDVSPPRGASRPHLNLESYDHHRSVSPLGSSRFEKPCTSSRHFTFSPLQCSSTVRESSYGTRDRESYDSSAYDCGYNHPTATSQIYGGPSGLSRSNAVRGRTSLRTYDASGENHLSHLFVNVPP